MKKSIAIFLKYLKRLLLIQGGVFLFFLLLGFTTIPFYLYHWLGTSLSQISEEPQYIVLMGGGGMPSESNLIRAFYVAGAAETFSSSKIIIALPGDLTEESSSPNLLADELERRGVDASRILFENEGTNTRSQALRLSSSVFSFLIDQPILIVSSPEHMRRSVLCFEEVGFTRVNALPAFEGTLEADLSFDDDLLGENKLFTPDIGHSKNLRYQFWNHLKYEILVARELIALGYYKICGWI